MQKKGAMISPNYSFCRKMRLIKAGITGLYFIISGSSRRFCVGICRHYWEDQNRTGDESRGR